MKMRQKRRARMARTRWTRYGKFPVQVFLDGRYIGGVVQIAPPKLPEPARSSADEEKLREIATALTQGIARLRLLNDIATRPLSSFVSVRTSI